MTKKENEASDLVEYWTKAWTKSDLTNHKTKSTIIKNVVDWTDKSYNDLQPYHISYKRQIYIKLGGFRCLLNKYKKL